METLTAIMGKSFFELCKGHHEGMAVRSPPVGWSSGPWYVILGSMSITIWSLIASMQDITKRERWFWIQGPKSNKCKIRLPIRTRGFHQVEIDTQFHRAVPEGEVESAIAWTLLFVSFENWVLLRVTLTKAVHEWRIMVEPHRPNSLMDFGTLHTNVCQEPLWEVPPVTRSWRKYRAGKAFRDPIHDEVMRKIPDRQGCLG